MVLDSVLFFPACFFHYCQIYGLDPRHAGEKPVFPAKRYPVKINFWLKFAFLFS